MAFTGDLSNMVQRPSNAQNDPAKKRNSTNKTTETLGNFVPNFEVFTILCLCSYDIKSSPYFYHEQIPALGIDSFL